MRMDMKEGVAACVLTLLSQILQAQEKVETAAKVNQLRVTDIAAETPLLSELRLGILHHDINSELSSAYEPSPDINAELLFAPRGFLENIGGPRPHMGASFNTRGGTSQFYAGLTWDWRLDQTFFVEGTLGGAIHNGNLDSSTQRRKALGSRFLFRESISLGKAFGAHHTASIIVDHVSHAGLGGCNPGITSLGARYGYRF